MLSPMLGGRGSKLVADLGCEKERRMKNLFKLMGFTRMLL